MVWLQIGDWGRGGVRTVCHRPGCTAWAAGPTGASPCMPQASCASRNTFGRAPLALAPAATPAHTLMGCLLSNSRSLQTGQVPSRLCSLQAWRLNSSNDMQALHAMQWKASTPSPLPWVGGSISKPR